MKRLILLPITLLLLSCSTSKENPIESSLTCNYDYLDVEDRFMVWSDLLIREGNYYCYIFSQYCTHCENIKQAIISKALTTENFYFITFQKDIVPIIADVGATIGQTDISQIGILGTPTIIEINNHMVKYNEAGEKAVLSFFENI